MLELEAYLTVLFVVLAMVAVYSKLQQGSVRKVDVGSTDLMTAIKRGRRTELDDKLDAKRKRLMERMKG